MVKPSEPSQYCGNPVKVMKHAQQPLCQWRIAAVLVLLQIPQPLSCLWLMSLLDAELGAELLKIGYICVMFDSHHDKLGYKPT